MDPLTQVNFGKQSQEAPPQNPPPPFAELYPDHPAIRANTDEIRFCNTSFSTDNRIDGMEEEDEPLLDGPVTVPFVPHVPVITECKALPRPLIHVVEKIVPPILAITKKGITKTEIIIESKTLSQIKVTIDHYDTAPHSFNIEVSGDERVQALFLKYQLQLVQSLQVALPTFQIHLLPPVFLVKTKRVGYVPKIRKKNDA